MWKVLVTLILLPTAPYLALAQSENICLTNTLNGQIRGQLVISGSGKEVCAFYGIPYAQPPIGNLRFRRPLPIGNWENVFNATSFPNMCTQNKTIGFSGHQVKALETSEDCLYLNIWAPLSLFNSTSKSGHVMIWIHGGGYLAGSISEPLINNPILAGENDVIVAFMQYRLGPLASIYFGTEEAPGNSGVLDQNLGIKWLYENIQGFGGNKDQITIFGQSAGGFATSFHALSPLSNIYMKRAILLSGAAGYEETFIFRTKKNAMEFSYDVAEHTGCYSKTDNFPEDVNEIINCMRTKDKFLITYSSYKPKYGTDLEGVVTVDDYFLTDTPDKLLEDPQNSLIDIMLGQTRDEGSYLLYWLYPEYFTKDEYPSFTLDEYKTLMQKLFSNLPSIEQDIIINHYTHWENFNDTHSNAQKIVQAIGDFAIVCPSLDFANKWSNNRRKVYSYWFTHEKENSYLCGDLWMGVCHGAELEYVFGAPLNDPSSPESEKDLSRHMQKLFIDFAKTGNPSENWGTYSVSSPVYLDINGTVISDTSTKNIFGPRPYDCSFWNIVLPKLRKHIKEIEREPVPEPKPNYASVISSNLFYVVLLTYLTIMLFL